MKRILFLIAVLLALPLFADKPNVIVIMADDMGWECVSAYRDLIAKYNYPKAKPDEKDHYSTPNIDKLAADGMRFDHGYSQPICTPSRVQIMTGIYNQRNYVKFGLLDPKAKKLNLKIPNLLTTFHGSAMPWCERARREERFGLILSQNDKKLSPFWRICT